MITPRDLLKATRDLEFESQRVYSELVEKDWNRPPSRRRLPRALWAFMMLGFGHIDFVSALWKGTDKGQSRRMTDFMERYLGMSRRPASMAVKIWRHKLMHTGEPRKVIDRATGKTCSWLLHWAHQLPANQHATTNEQGKEIILQMSLSSFLADLKIGQRTYLRDLRADKKLDRKFQSFAKSIDKEFFHGY